MEDAPAPAPSERGWGKLLLALAAFLIIPPYTPLRALLPVEDTLLLLLPALAACCLVGWWAGGRLLLAVAWVGLVGRGCCCSPRTRGPFYNLVRGWSLLLAGSFGLICLFGTGRPFFSRALSAVSLALTLVLLMSSRGPLTPSRARLAVQAEFARRNTETLAIFRTALQRASRGGEVDAAGRIAAQRGGDAAAHDGGDGDGTASRPCCCSSRSSRSRWRGGRTIASRARASARRSAS